MITRKKFINGLGGFIAMAPSVLDAKINKEVPSASRIKMATVGARVFSFPRLRLLGAFCAVLFSYQAHLAWALVYRGSCSTRLDHVISALKSLTSWS